MSNRPVAKNKAAAKGGGGRKQHYGYSPQAVGPDSESKPMAVWIALGVLGVAAVVGIVVAAVAGGGGSKEAVTQDVQVSGTRLPAMPESSTPIVIDDPAAGLGIPTLSGKGFDGTPITIDDTGGPGFVIFVAHWCPHCQAEVPRIVQYRKDGKIPKSLKIWTVSTGVDRTRGNYPPSSWLDEAGWTEPVLADDKEGTAGQAFGLGGFPYLLAIDADGKVVKRSSGELSEADMLEMVAAATGQGADTSATTVPAADAPTSQPPAG